MEEYEMCADSIIDVIAVGMAIALYSHENAS